jgi:molybdenum cofactor biosynthesis enzyme MoaA
VNLKDAIRAGAGIEEVRKLLLEAIASKPEQHELVAGDTGGKKMSSIGG